MIVISHLTKRYGKITALNDVSCTFDNGQVTAIMGENGAGKSTLLKICAGILPFDAGEISIDGYSLLTTPLQARKETGYLPEVPELYDRLTGREFLYYIASLRKIQRAQTLIENYAHFIGIEEALDYELGSYSKGMKQKISMISAILHTPNNLLLDEPVYGLDPLSSRTIQEFITERKGTTVIATHSTQLVERVADVVYFLIKGRIITSDKVDSLVQQHGSIEHAYFYYKEGHHA